MTRKKDDTDNVKWLRFIVQLASEKKIQTLFLHTPVTKFYISHGVIDAQRDMTREMSTKTK